MFVGKAHLSIMLWQGNQLNLNLNWHLFDMYQVYEINDYYYFKKDTELEFKLTVHNENIFESGNIGN